MKVSDLIEQIKDYPDFEVELTTVTTYESKQRPTYNTYPIIGVADIGHSSKVVVLDGGEEHF